MRELYKHGIRLKIRPQPLQMLHRLVSHPGDVVTRDQLRQQLWSADTFVDFEHSLNTAMKELRSVLGDVVAEPRYIETLPRLGYRFIASVHAGQIPPGAVTATHKPPVGPEPAQPLAAVNGGATVSATAGLPALPQPAQAGQSAAIAAAPAQRMHRRPPVVMLLAGIGAVLAIFASGWVAIHVRNTGSSTHPGIKSLVVLPLKNLSGDPAQEYLADGMTEALVSRLSGIHNLRVISRTSSMRLKNSDLSLPEIAKMLQVDAVVEGSVIRQGNRIRVTAQLIRGSSDQRFWSEVYDRELPDVLALQSDVAQAIARKIEVTLTGKERERLAAAHAIAPEVYESYLKGHFELYNANSKAGFERSIAYFAEAIKKDPSFAPAYVGLGNAYIQLGTVLVGAPPEKERAKAVSAARIALELDPDLAEAHVLLADAYEGQWRWAEAEAEYRRAIELNPNNADAHAGLAFSFLSHGRTEEALTWARRGRELDPVSVHGTDVGWILSCSRRYDDAIREYQNVLALKPDALGSLWKLGITLTLKGQPEQAIPLLEKAISVSARRPAVVAVLIVADAHAGRRSDARRLLAELKRRKHSGYVPADAFVIAYIGLGDNEQAFAWLEQAYKERSDLLQLVKVHPLLDPLRGDPRFADLLHRVGLG
ncbi:MAG TPA: tetratricopeptide repeat protein [Candidatus Acidoferrales bacterium]|nr:tetratricopeptide repeat protein [Candidatus Acidoferrales bacterium]